MSIYSPNPVTEDNTAEDETIKALKFQPTKDMKQDKNGVWRWKAGTKDEYGKSIAGSFVKGAPSANPSGRNTREKEVLAFCQEASMDMAMVLYQMAMDPEENSKVRVTCANTLLDRALGKPKQQTEIITNNNIQDLIRPIIIQSQVQPEQENE